MSSVWSVRRSTVDGKVGGVCSGLARHADVDPLLVRVAAVLLALSGGLGLVVYGAAWLLIPDETGHAPVDQHFPTLRRWKRSSLIAAVVIAAVVVASVFSTIAPFSVASAFVLALIWYFGYYKNRPSRPRPEDATTAAATPPAVAAPLPPAFHTFTGPPTPFTEAAAGWQARITEVQRQSAATPTAAVQQPWPTMPAPGLAPTTAMTDPTPDPRAEWDRQQFLAAPDPVGLYTETEPVPVPVAKFDPRRSVAARRLRLSWLLTTGLVIAGLSIAAAAGASISLTVYLASALLVAGIALVIGAFLGRARGVLAVTVLLALAIGATSVTAPFRDVDSWSQSTPRYVAQADIPPTSHLDGGSLEIDLSDVAITEDQTYAVSVGTGNLEIARPADGNVRIEYTVDTGAVDLPGDTSRAGRQLTDVVEPAGGLDPDEPVLTIEAEVEFGVLQVTR